MYATALCGLVLVGLDGSEGLRLVSTRYGLTAELPKAWRVVEREQQERIWVAILPGVDGEKPGVVACELAIAPESLEDWKTRIDGNARQEGARTARAGAVVRNEIVETPGGPRLDTVREFQPVPGQTWVERSVRVIAHRQLYRFVITATAGGYARHRAGFEAVIDSARFRAPETGCKRVDRAGNRWQQREFLFAIDLPEGWSPALAPAEIALLYATAPPVGIWSDNCLVIARPHTDIELAEVRAALPDQLKHEDPNCEVLACELVPQGRGQALETIVRTQRGPFSMTVIERRFRGERFDYEIKCTLETERFERLLPKLRSTLDSFEELPGAVPSLGKPA